MSRIRRLGALLAALIVAAVLAFVPPADAAGTPALRVEPIDAPFLSVAGVGDYRGVIEVRGSGSLAVINDVDLDDYVQGLAEVPGTWPEEALKAQAIAARTYALWQKASTSTAAWRQAGADICATESCQVYTGVNRERLPGGALWNAAVQATTGHVLLWKGLIIPAMYSSSNGGRTVSGGRPWFPSIEDPDDAASPLHRWRYAVPLPSIAALFAIEGELFDVGRDGGSIVFTSRLPDGTELQSTIGATVFRDRLNTGYPTPAGLPKTVPSTRFTVYTNGDGAVVDGGGWGHGIGMSQYGALGKARRGMPAADILATYYGGVRPTVLPPGQIPATVRVAVAMGQSAVTVSSPKKFRIVDQDGRVVVAEATGRWRIGAGGGGLQATRLDAPDDREATMLFLAALAKQKEAEKKAVPGPADGAPVAPPTTAAAPVSPPPSAPAAPSTAPAAPEAAPSEASEAAADAVSPASTRRSEEASAATGDGSSAPAPGLVVGAGVLLAGAAAGLAGWRVRRARRDRLGEERRDPVAA